MTTREFVFIPTLPPGTIEVTLDRNTHGHERTCNLCHALISRHEPTPAEGERSVVDEPGAAIRLDVNAHVPHHGVYQLNLPMDLCGACTFGLMTFLAPAVAEFGIHHGHNIPAPILEMLGLKLEEPVDVDQPAEVDEPAKSDADELASV